MILIKLASSTRHSTGFLQVTGLVAFLMWPAASVICSDSTTATDTGRELTSRTLKVVDYLLPSKVSRPRTTSAPVDMIMLHFVSDVLKNPNDPYQVNRIAEMFTSYTVSSHYLIGRDGKIYRFVPEERIAFHAGKGRLHWIPERKDKLNEHAIGIELMNVGSWRDMKIFMKKSGYDAFAAKYPERIGFTSEQYKSLSLLITDIRSRHAIPMDRYHVVGHDEYAGVGRRTDPGELFDWRRIGLTKSRPPR